MVAGAFFTAGATAAGTAAMAAGAEGLGIPASAAGFGLGLSVELPLIGAVTYGRIAGIGAMIALGGVSQLLSPVPHAAPSFSAERPEARPSFIYVGPTNTAEQGGPIPIVYGRMRIGSALVSSSVSTDQVEGAQGAGAVSGTTARASFSGGEL
jgi:predicted phage tail protein